MASLGNAPQMLFARSSVSPARMRLGAQSSVPSISTWSASKRSCSLHWFDVDNNSAPSLQLMPVRFRRSSGTWGPDGLAATKSLRSVFPAAASSTRSSTLLSAGPKRLIGFGSANLTSGGLGGNLELMLFANEANDEGRQLIGGAARFLDRLVASGAAQMPASAREFIQTTLAGIPRASNAVLDSLHVALLEQMARSHLSAARGHDTRHLTILSPWHSSGASAEGVSPAVLRELKRSFKAEQMAVFTEGQNDRGPALGRGISVHIRSEAMRPVPSTENGAEEEALENAVDHRPTRVHAKAYLAESKSGGSTLFFGSANCTQPALMRSVSAGGNVELLVASALDKRAVAAVRADLTDLFKPPRDTAAIAPASAPAKPAGAILAGDIVGTRHGIYLGLEAPSVRRGDLHISRGAKGPRVRVQVRNGYGRVQDPAHLSSLFGADHPSRESGNWACVLWERLGTGAVPFPVSFPLLAAGGDSPESVFSTLCGKSSGCGQPSRMTGRPAKACQMPRRKMTMTSRHSRRRSTRGNSIASPCRSPFSDEGS